MPSIKKRKLNGSSEPPPLSAFAALKTQNQRLKRNTPSSGNQSPRNASASVPVSPVKRTSVDRSLQDVVSPNPKPAVAASHLVDAENALEDIEDDLESSFQSRAESPEVLLETPAIPLSTFKPGKNNVRELKDGTLFLKLAPGERLVILGQCEISVQKGQITLLGATLQQSKTKYRVSVPLSHSLPVLRCLATDLDAAEISVYQCETSLEHLMCLSPLFGKLWNDGIVSMGPENNALSSHKKSSFQILFSSDDAPKGAYLQPIISPPEWNEALSKFSNHSQQKPPRILVCGPKSSGKSTFTKLLSNRVLSAAEERITASCKKGQNSVGVAILDLDPGQPEYSVPGQLSLVLIQEPNFGPPFSHPIPDGNGRIVRAHSIAAITPSMDPSLYLACALDLFAHYRNLLSSNPNYPLVVNTPGWVLGTGLEVLVDLITKIQPTEVVYMSQDGPSEVVETLRDAAKSTPVITLPSQASKYMTKTAAHLRTMQAMSYFHIDPNSKTSLTWRSQPLTSVPPWEITYSGENAGIIGIMSYGEQPPPDLLLDSINGSLLAVVVLDDMAAIPGWQTEEQEIIEEGSAQRDDPYPMDLQDTELRVLDDGSLHPQHLQKPLLVRTPIEDLPYFNPANAISLNPKYSHCIGLALVRGIDVPRCQLQIITAISSSVIAEVNENGKPIVLVSGKFDTPGWAYTEELMQKQSLEKAAKKSRDLDVDCEEGEEESDTDDVQQEGRSLGEGFQNAPWVERQEGSQGRAVGSRVWRVRRDLGRSGD